MWTKKYRDKIATFICADHTDVQGVRKVSAMEASTISKTSLPSVFHWRNGALELYRIFILNLLRRETMC
jgi:hypothetical protein